MGVHDDGTGACCCAVAVGMCAMQKRRMMDANNDTSMVGIMLWFLFLLL
jgi:hypothetical protein